jgi:heat shock protein HslJ
MEEQMGNWIRNAGVAGLALAIGLNWAAPTAANGEDVVLAGSVWAWDQAPANPADGAGLEAATATLSFTEDAVMAFLGCNQSSGAYALGPGEALSFTMGGMTKMLCADMMYEQRLYDLLGRVARIRIEDVTMVLSDPDGAELARLIRQ